MNAREQLKEISDWLGSEDEALSFGLRNSLDALALYDYAKAQPELFHGYVTEWDAEDRIAALGYDPLETDEAYSGRDVEETGALAAQAALLQARTLLDSVAFVSTEGDTAPVLTAIDAVLCCAVKVRD